MMKKTTSALAIAALLGTGAASAATFQVNDDTTITLFGDLQFAYYDQNDTNGDSASNITDNASSLVFGAEQVQSNGLTTFGHIDLDGFGTLEDDTSSAGTGATDLTVDEAIVGVRGDFGSIAFGRNEGAYEMVADYFDYQEGIIPTAIGPGDISRVVQYRNSVDNVDFGIDVQVNSDDEKAATDGSSASFAGSIAVDLDAVVLTGAYDQRANGNDDPRYGAVASFGLGDVGIDLGYQLDDGDNASDILSLGGRYTYGPGDLYGVAQNISYDNKVTNDQARNGEDSFTEVAIGANYNVGTNMYVWAEYGQYDLNDDENDGLATGVYYSF